MSNLTPEVISNYNLPPAQHFVSDGKSVEFARQGKGPAILYFHGSGAGFSTIFPREQMLIKDGFELIVPNRPGFKGTSILHGKTPIDSARLGAQLLDHLSIDRAIIMGLSGGGPGALSFCQRYPERANGLVLQSAQTHTWTEKKYLPKFLQPHYSSIPFLGRVYFLIRLSRQARNAMTDRASFSRGFVGERLSQLKSDPLTKAIIDLVYDAYLNEDHMTGSRNDISIFNGSDYFRQHTIKCPTLVIHDPLDPTVPVAHAEHAAAGIKNSKFLEVNAAGHFIWCGRDGEKMHQGRLRFLQGLNAHQKSNLAEVKIMVETIPLSSDATRKPRVFISYSRKDGSFADRLREGLIARGFDAYLDKHDILPGEDWKKRLSGLITRADVVVFCLSPNFVGSKICDWEVNEAELLGKRLLPTVLAEPDPDKTPGRIKRLNYIFMREDDDFVDGLGEIESAINTDIDWIREQTRLTERSAQWLKFGKSERSLLRGKDIAIAENWITRRPHEAPDITELIGQYIAESRKAETAREERARLRNRIISGASIAAAIIMTYLGYQMYLERQQAITEKLRAEESQLRANEQATLARKLELDARAQEYKAALVRLKSEPINIDFQKKYFEAGNKLGFTFIRHGDNAEKSEQKKEAAKNARTTFDYVENLYGMFVPVADPDSSVMLEKLITAIGLSEAHLKNKVDTKLKAQHKLGLWKSVVTLYEFTPPKTLRDRWKDNIFRGFGYASTHSFDARNYEEAFQRALSIVQVMAKPPLITMRDHRYAARAYGKLAWNALFVGKFDVALKAATKAQEIIKKHKLERLQNIEINYPHALMFNGRLEEAKTFYRSQRKGFINDEFEELIRGGLCHPYILDELSRPGRCVDRKYSSLGGWSLPWLR